MCFQWYYLVGWILKLIPFITDHVHQAIQGEGIKGLSLLTPRLPNAQEWGGRANPKKREPIRGPCVLSHVSHNSYNLWSFMTKNGGKYHSTYQWYHFFNLLSSYLMEFVSSSNFIEGYSRFIGYNKGHMVILLQRYLDMCFWALLLEWRHCISL